MQSTIDKNKHNLFSSNSNKIIINNSTDVSADSSLYDDCTITTTSSKIHNKNNNNNKFHNNKNNFNRILHEKLIHLKEKNTIDVNECLFTMERLQNYFNDVESKVSLLNNGYMNLKKTIKDEFDYISHQIHNESVSRKRELNELEAKLDNDIKLKLYEIMFDLKQKYELNESADEKRREINKMFEAIQCDYQKRDEMTQEETSALLEKIQQLSTMIDDNPKLSAPILPDNIVKFSKSDTHLELPVIGEIFYDNSYRLDIVNQVKNLNDQFKMVFVDLNKVFKESGVTKSVTLISKNKILYIYEKMYGRIKTTSLFIVYSYDMTILRKTEIDHHLETLVTHCVYDRTICLVFRKGKKDFLIKLFDIDLTFLREKFIDFEPTKVKMNKNRIFFINEMKKTNCLREFDHDLNYIKKFGQLRTEKRSYCLKGDLIALNENKIFIKYKNMIKVLSYSTGKLLYSFTINDMDDRARVFLEYHTEKFLVYNGFTRISYFNHEGNLLATNKLRLIDHHFDEFQFTMNGNFAFINNDKKYLIII